MIKTKKKKLNHKNDNDIYANRTEKHFRDTINQCFHDEQQQPKDLINRYKQIIQHRRMQS